MRYKFLLIFIFLFCFDIVEFTAQTTHIDSLRNIIQQHTSEDTNKVKLLNKLGGAVQNINPDSSLEYINRAYAIADSLNYVSGMAEALFLASCYHYIISDFDKVLEYGNKSLDIFKEVNDKRGIAKTLIKIGNIHYFQGDVERAMKYKHEALEINQELHDTLALSNTYANLGTNYCDIGDFSRALEYEEKALELAKATKHQQSISYALNNLGVVHNVMGNYPKALEYYQKSFHIDESQKNYKDAAVAASNVAFILNIQGEYDEAISFCQKGLDYSEQIGFKTGLTYNYEYLGLIYKTKGDYNKAWENHQKALVLQTEIGNKTGLANAYKDLGEILNLQGKYNEAVKFYNNSLSIGKAIDNKQIVMKSYVGLSLTYLKQNDYINAQKYSQIAYVLANDIGNIDLIAQSADLLAKSKAALGKHKEAYNLYTVFKNMSDSLFNEENVRSIANLEYQYKFEKEKELFKIEQQKKDAVRAEEEKLQKMIRNSLLVGVLLMLVLVLVILHSFLQKSKANLLLAEQKKQIEDTNEELITQKEEIQIVAQELEKANKTKDKFFSIIAHDLKSPFNGLIGFTELLLENHKSYNHTERETYLQYIQDCSLKTYNLLDNLLTWAQSQSGLIKFNPEKIKMKSLVDDIILLLSETAGNKNIELVSDTQDDLALNADKNMLHTIILNLVSNAIKFTPKGGSITVKSLVESYHSKQKVAKIIVKDTGVGIPAEIQRTLFTLNGNYTTTGTNKEKGTGLGLLLCKEFVDQHDGKIIVNSQVNKGSEFEVSIPFFN